MKLTEAFHILAKNGYEFTRLNENNDLSDYLLQRVYQVATEIYTREIADHAPNLDSTNRPDHDYLQRFDYLSDSLKAAVKRAAVALKNDLAAEGFDIHEQNVETEIFDALKLYAKDQNK